MIIWTAGIAGNSTEGLKPDCFSRSGRIIVDSYNRVSGYPNVFAIGDISLQTEEKYPRRTSSGCPGSHSAGTAFS